MQEEQELVTVTVSVPRRRLGDLYRLVAGLNDASGQPPAETTSVQSWGADDVEVAGRLYSLVSPTAKRILDELMVLGEGSISGGVLASKVGLENGAYGVAGSLSSVGKAAAKVSRELPYRAAPAEATGGASVYGMEPQIADLFQAAKAARGARS